MSQYSFTISDEVLRSACMFNNIDIENRQDEMILFAIRGALPAENGICLLDYTNHIKFENDHLLERVHINYYYPRCVIGQWLPAERKVAVFPGSTVPNLKVVERNRKRKHEFNCMVPGFYDYVKGQHPRSDSGYQPHRAIRLNSQITLRRANYTMRSGQPVIDYGPTASISVSNPGDNIHCARNNPSTTRVSAIRGTNYSPIFCMSDYYSSYGCQVIVGCPPQYIPRGQSNGDWNAWDKFISNAYDDFAQDQTNFKYLLLDSADVLDISETNTSHPALFKVLHGSSGPQVERLQRGLQRMRSANTGNPYYSGTIDGDFGRNTSLALIQFQKDTLNGRALGYANEDTFRSLGV
ncbi:peptidoglycan-binding domain-containing protein [Algibacter lectus]|uniref:peptidoglycan-binding domain-containing protein n=1 Tax=Algibacter lectus TaxID=221126 RepID=UPI0024952664|nr:peptidoglycan-binding domain-containing protein [Algibacter lectus]